MTRLLALSAAAVALVVSLVLAAGRPNPAPSADPLRRPVAAVLLKGRHAAAVANTRTGTLTVVDLDSGRVEREVRVGESLSDLAAIPGTPFLLALDENAAHAVLVEERRGEVTVRGRTPVCRAPVSLAVAPDGRSATVAGLWSHQLDVLDLSDVAAASPAVRVARSIELPFAPRTQIALPAGRVAVADSFGGRLALVDAAGGRIEAVHAFDGHNVRGMTLSPDGASLFLAHQILDQDALINWQTVHSGRLMANVIRRLPVARLADSALDLDAESEILPAGMTGHGGGDPTGLATFDDGHLAVCLGGVGEVVLLNRHQVITGRVAVGRRPVQILSLGSELKNAKPARALVVNTFSDSLTIVDLAAGAVVREIPLGPSRPLTPLERGEVAFYDARLSHDGWLSCHSCHSDGHTNGLLSDTFGDGTDGAPKRVLTLLGSAHTNRWAWNGTAEELYDQVRKSMLTTLLSDGVDAGTAADLVVYLESLPPPPARQPAGAAADRKQIARGRQVFLDHNCQNCHVPPLTYSSTETYDVGLEDANGLRKFNPPSLRGIGHATAFFHDNRARSLESVFRDHAHPGDTSLTDNELADLVRFLKSL